MTTPAQVTEAHLELAKTVIFSRDSAGRLLTAPMGAQLIADSEALACAELRALVGTIRSQLNLIPRNVGDITPEGHSHETGAAIDQLRAEAERLREWQAGVIANERLHHVERKESIARAARAEADLHALRLICGTTDADKFSTWVDRANARAEKAEADLAKAKAVLASIEEDGTEEHNAAVRLRQELAAEREKVRVLRDEFTPRIAQYLGNGGLFNPELMDAHQTSLLLRDIRDAIDAAMKEGSA